MHLLLDKYVWNIHVHGKFWKINILQRKNLAGNHCALQIAMQCTLCVHKFSCKYMYLYLCLMHSNPEISLCVCVCICIVLLCLNLFIISLTIFIYLLLKGETNNNKQILHCWHQNESIFDGNNNEWMCVFFSPLIQNRKTTTFFFK